MFDLQAELTAAVEELVAHVQATAHGWNVDVHGETVDTRTVEAAADHIQHWLEH